VTTVSLLTGRADAIKKGRKMPYRAGGSDNGGMYVLVRSRRRKRTLSLQLKKDGCAVIHAPWRTSRAEIEDFFQRKKSWLEEKRREMENHDRESAPHSFLAGEVFLFLGMPCRLEIDDGGKGLAPLTFSGGCFLLKRTDIPRARSHFTAWYRTRAEEYLAQRVDRFGRLLLLHPRGIRLSDARCRWGTCSHDNRLSFSWRLVMAPPSVIDYVVVHELTHIREKNHSRRFWELLAKTIPGYGEEKAWLHDRGHLLDV
jgi:predicted metal-dependent hydrolase